MLGKMPLRRRPGLLMLIRATVPFGRPESRRSSSRKNGGVPRINVPDTRSKSARPAEQTLEEIKYLKRLIEQKITVCVKLSDDEEVRGTIEYYDQRFIRITRVGAPNLFIFKHDIKYLYEVN
jgi:sRNA-binding regulator protein Hfq